MAVKALISAFVYHIFQFVMGIHLTQGIIENLEAGFAILVFQVLILNALISRITVREEQKKWAGVRRSIFDQLRLSFVNICSGWSQNSSIRKAAPFFLGDFEAHRERVWREKLEIFRREHPQVATAFRL